MEVAKYASYNIPTRYTAGQRVAGLQFRGRLPKRMCGGDRLPSRHRRILNTIESCHCRCQDSLVYMRALLQGSMSDKLRATLEEEIADRERDLVVSFDLD